MAEQVSNIALITERELSKLLKVSVSSLARWRQSGHGPRFLALGPRRIIYRRSDVDAWLDKNAIGGTAPEAAATAA
jgi:predicted DNA-binding transcriptional regulator AlpA